MELREQQLLALVAVATGVEAKQAGRFDLLHGHVERQAVTIAPDLGLFRRFNQQFYRLFEKDITKQCARYRRTRMVNDAAYQANTFLAKALKKISKEKFDKMIVFLGWENVDRTNNHVERNNRVFRMLQKTRYKRRKVHTIEKAIELELYSRMLCHPLYDESFQKRHPPGREESITEIAA